MKILVGVADDATSIDAVTFAATLAQTFAADVTVVTVTAGEPDDATAQLVAGFASALPGADSLVHHHRSLGQGLSEVADKTAADLVVVGSGPGGSLGRFTMGSTTNQLLHHIAAPLVLVPSGYARHPLPSLRRIMVAFAQGAEGERALIAGADLARAGNLPMDVMTILVRHRMFGSDLGADAEGDVLTSSLQMLRDYQREGLAQVDTTGLAVSSDVLVGDSLAEAMDREEWQPGDLLVVASAGGGILRRVFLGDTTFKILRASTVPTVVLPRHHE